MAASPPSWLEDAFKSAKEDFKRSLRNPALYDFSKINSVDDVLDEAKKIERQQVKTKTLRGLKRIEPLVNGLKEYADVIEVFVQAKPDIMALIWGPLKFVLQVSSNAIKIFEKVVKVIADLGMTLPSFKTYAQLFESNHDIRRALCLFFADILDFYAILLNFLTNRKFNVVLESLWPNIRSSIAKVQENIEHHKAIMTANVTLEDILQAHQGRKRALEEYERQQLFRDGQTYRAIRNELAPYMYDAELEDILRQSSVEPGKWLKSEPDFIRWLDASDRTLRRLWLHGIPGSGKTFLVGHTVKRMQASGQRVLFVFLSYDNRPAGDTVKVLHSLIFQLLEDKPTLRPILFEASQLHSRKLRSDPNFVLDLLCNIINGLGPCSLALDGVDELDENSWKHLLSSVLRITETCPEAKLLISSREERDISLRLKDKATPLRVDHKNYDDIDAFVQLERDEFLVDIRRYGADEKMCFKIKEALSTIADRSEGMFIYARLVLQMVKDQEGLDDIEEQIENLPDGLDQVYGRLLTRIKSKRTQNLRSLVRTVLQWVACAQRPLREEELLQILAVEPGKPDFTKGRKAFRDLCKDCGPIIEVNGGALRFVHFSAKEYLLHEQSGSYLNLFEAHLGATILCTTYLSFLSLNLLFSASPVEIVEIQEQIIGGDYVMFEYASTAFLEHLKGSLETPNQDIDVGLLAALNRFRETRGQLAINPTQFPERFLGMFERFADQPQLQLYLAAIAYSQVKAQGGFPDEDDIMDPSANDPLKLFLARRVLRRRMEEMICQGSDHRPGCRCDDIKRLYGTKLYHCDQPSCHAYRMGFESRLARDRHLTIHQRSHKCPKENCLFAEIGFRYTTELDKHTSTAHPSHTPKTNEAELVIPPVQPPDDLYRIIMDAVALDQIQIIRQLPSAVIPSRYMPDILLEAAEKASPSILSYLLGHCTAGIRAPLKQMLAKALLVENLPNIKFLLSRRLSMSMEVPKFYAGSRRHNYPIGPAKGHVLALRTWSPDLIAFLVDELRVDIPVPYNCRTSGEEVGLEDIFRGPFRKENYTDEEMRRRFDGIKKYIPPEMYTRGLRVAVGSGWVFGVRICLENGGNPNIPGPAFRTVSDNHAFHYALRSRNPEVVKVLLQYGAIPNTKGLRTNTKGGALKTIEKSFRLGWEEITRRIQEGEDLPILWTPKRRPIW